jgi:hypothetical protein
MALEDPYELFLDHDLGNQSDQDGYQLLQSLVRGGRAPARVWVVTNNPAGRKNIEEYLKSADYKKIENHWDL